MAWRGVRLRQTWIGAYVLSADRWNERGLVLELATAGHAPAAAPLLAPLSRGLLDVEGTIRAEGLAERKPIRGKIDFGRVADAVLAYRAVFEADDGGLLSLGGVQRISRRALRYSLTTFCAEIRGSDDALIAVAELRLDIMRTANDLLGSFRRSVTAPPHEVEHAKTSPTPGEASFSRAVPQIWSALSSVCVFRATESRSRSTKVK